jgi:hypothetical protein
MHSQSFVQESNICKARVESTRVELLTELHFKGLLVYKIAKYLTWVEERTMEQRTLKNENNCLNTNIYSYLGTSGGQSSNLLLNVANFFNTSVN